MPVVVICSVLQSQGGVTGESQRGSGGLSRHPTLIAFADSDTVPRTPASHSRL